MNVQKTILISLCQTVSSAEGMDGPGRDTLLFGGGAIALYRLHETHPEIPLKDLSEQLQKTIVAFLSLNTGPLPPQDAQDIIRRAIEEDIPLETLLP